MESAVSRQYTMIVTSESVFITLSNGATLRCQAEYILNGELVYLAKYPEAVTVVLPCPQLIAQSEPLDEQGIPVWIAEQGLTPFSPPPQ